MKILSINKKHIPWVDYAKAIGIFAIVFGHAVQAGDANKYVYSFHLPLFLFLSGFVFSAGKDGFKRFASQRAFSFLVPYVIFSVISVSIFAVMGSFVQDSLASNRVVGSIPQQIKNVILGICDTNAPLWYLPCIFLLQLGAWRIDKWIKKSNVYIVRKNRALLVLVLCALWLPVNKYLLHIKFIPYSMQSGIHLFAFFMLGYVFRLSGMERTILGLPTGTKLGYGGLFMLSGLVLSILNGKVGYTSNAYGHIELYFLAALCSVVGIVLVCMSIKSCNPLEFVGQNTLGIMVMHKFPVVFFQTLCPVVKVYLKQNSVIVGIAVSVICIVMCVVAELVINRFCPLLLGRKKRTLQ